MIGPCERPPAGSVSIRQAGGRAPPLSPVPEPRGSREGVGCLGALLGSLVAALRFIPVNHVPPRLYVLRPPVLVLEVVGVLPHVQPYHRHLAFHKRGVLVGGGLDRERALGGSYQPRPTAPEQGPRRRRRPELLLEALEGAERGVYGATQLTGRLAASLTARPHYLPEHRVV